MFYSTFRVTDAEGAGTHQVVRMLLPDDFLDLIHSRVAGHRSDELLVIELDECLHADTSALQQGFLLWQRDAGHFSVVVAQEQVGVVPLDEVIGAARHAYSPDAMECRVGLYYNGCYVWRRGLLDLRTGDVSVYTNLSRLDYTPAIAVVSSTSGTGENLIVELLPGPVATRPLHVHSIQRDWLRTELAPTQQPVVVEQEDEIEPFSIYGQLHDELRCLFEGDQR
jgi:hypothetical protein